MKDCVEYSFNIQVSMNSWPVDNISTIVTDAGLSPS